MLLHKHAAIYNEKQTVISNLIFFGKYIFQFDSKYFKYYTFNPKFSHPSSTCRSTEIVQFNLHTPQKMDWDHNDPATRNPDACPIAHRKECSSAWSYRNQPLYIKLISPPPYTLPPHLPNESVCRLVQAAPHK